MVEPQQGYLGRLAELDALVGRARLSPDALIERAAGLVAGIAGCRVGEARTYLARLAETQGRDVAEVAVEAVAALEDRNPGGSQRLHAVLDQALRLETRLAWPPAAPPAADAVTGSWVSLVQEVLNGLPGGHVLLMPLRDQAGEIDDYMVAAASPQARDVVGRRGPEMIGLRVRQAYPGAADALWQAYQEVLADGVPREIGPFPYAGPAHDVPAHLTLTVRVHPAGPGLFVTWIRHDEQVRLGDRIAQTERLGNLGWGEWDLVTGNTSWSEGLYRIYERDPSAGPLTREETAAMVVPEDEGIREQAAAAFGRGETADVTYRIRVNGRIKHIRAIADAERDIRGRPLRVYGIIQDVTARESSRTKLARVERQLRQHQRSLAAENRLAAQLQHIILPLPVTPIDLPGLRVAVRYLPAEQASRVGGDWYHADTAHDGSVIVAVGDVAGHGIRAATTMAQLRHALAALTVTTTDPAELLTHLNRLLYGSGGPAGIATAVVARYAPATGEVVWAQAGHLAPLHVRRGATRELDRPPGPLLGAIKTARYGLATITLVPDDLLVFYTDGLIERRDRSLQDGLAPVIATLNRISAAGGPQPLSDLLAQLDRANPEDDTCILAARLIPWKDPAAAAEVTGAGPDGGGHG